MIHKLILRNFKGIESAELSFERLTVLVGPNASGKTSVLQALELLSGLANPQLSREQVVNRLGGIPVIRRHNVSDSTIIQAEGNWEQRPSRLIVDVRTTEPSKVNGKRDRLEVHLEHDGQRFDLPAFKTQPVRRGSSETEPLPPPEPLEVWRDTMLLRLEAPRLAEPSFTYDESAFPRIETNGLGLASMLAQMALNQPDNFSAFLDSLRSVIPQIKRVRLSLAKIEVVETEIIHIDGEPLQRRVPRTHSGHRIIFDLVGAADIPSEAASEGTLLVLGLLAVLFSTPRPKLLLLDDLDRGLHPRAQRDLVAQLRKLLELDPELQIIATSHSPYLVDCLEPKEVRLSNVLPDGTIHFAALTDHPDFERWKGVMHPGEFWSTVGETWVGGLRQERTDG